jgi:hypothetical protein
MYEEIEDEPNDKKTTGCMLAICIFSVLALAATVALVYLYSIRAL